MWRDDALLLDILLAAGDALEFVQGLDWIGFSNSKLHQSAVDNEVRLDVVWDVVQNDLPALIETLRPLIPPEDNFS